VQKSETVEAVTGSNSEERVEEETVNVHKNSLPERIAETRRVLIGSALKFRFGLEDVYGAWPETAFLAKCEDRVCQGIVAEKGAILTDVESKLRQTCRS